MTQLVAEFSAWNSMSLAQAFTQAIRDVSDQSDVQVVDVRHLGGIPHIRVELAVRAADRAQVLEAPCLAWLRELQVRQERDIGLSVGIAITGQNAVDEDAVGVVAALGPPPAGSWREIRAAIGVVELYEHMVQWLHQAIAGRPAYMPSATLAEDSALTISENLPRSSETQPNQYRIRQKP